MITKECTKCKQIKSVKEFYKTKTTNDGYTYNCRACYKKYRDEHREYIRQYMENLRIADNEKVKKARRKSWRELDPRKKLLQQAKNRARRKNIEFNITLEDIIIPNKCPLLNILFIIGTKNDYEYTYSLDRIDPNKGYVKGNIWVITKLANSMKNSASKKDLLTFAYNVIKYFKDDDIVRTNEKSLELEDKHF